MGGRAGVVVLEEYEHAKARGANIYAEVVGSGLSGDAYHVTAPHPDGFAAYLSMEMALKKAGITPADIDYINAHGTPTMADTLELIAVNRRFGCALGGGRSEERRFGDVCVRASIYRGCHAHYKNNTN